MGTKSYVNDDSMVYNPNTGTYSRAGDIRAGSGVLTQQAQDEAAIAQIVATLEAEAEEAAAAGPSLSVEGPKTDFPGINRDLTSDSIGGDAVDLGSVYSLFPDPVTGAVSAAMQNDALKSLLEEGQYQGLSDAERLDLFTELQATNAPRFISTEEGIRPATEQETEGFYDNIIDYLLGLGSVPTPTETETETETGPTLLEKAQAQANKIGRFIGKAQDALFDILGIPKPDYSVIQPNAPGGTVIWGQPSGGVFGRVGVTPGGTVVGVQTGIPALDILLGKTADIISGRVSAGEVLNTETIKDIVIETAADELGVDRNTAAEAIAGIKTAAQNAGVLLNQETGELEQTGKFGVDTAGGGEGPKDVAGGATITPSTSDGTSLPEGVAGPVKVVDTAGGEDVIDRTPTDRVVGDGFQLDSTGDDTKAPTLDVTKQTAGADTALTRTPALDTTKSTSEAPTVDRVASLLAGDSTDTDLSLDRVASLTAGAGGDTDLSLDRVLNLPTDRTVGNAPSLEGALNLTTDRVIGATPTVDRVASLIAGDGGDTTDLSLEGALSLTTDRTGTLDPTLTERAPTLSSTSDRADEVPDGGSVGGVGLGEEGGVRIVSGAPGDAVDIDYLFDIGGESIFAPTLEDEEEDKYRPYVYAKSGGMISTYDPVDELIRLLNQRY